MNFAPSEYWDQPGHPPSLIRVFTVRVKKGTHWAHKEDSDQTESLLGAQSFCLFCHEAAHLCSSRTKKRNWGYKIISGTKRPITLKLDMQHQVLECYQVCSNDDPRLTLTYFTARSNLVHYAFVLEKGKTMDFSVSLPLPLIQKEQLSVTGERMCTEYWLTA